MLLLGQHMLKREGENKHSHNKIIYRYQMTLVSKVQPISLLWNPDNNDFSIASKEMLKLKEQPYFSGIILYNKWKHDGCFDSTILSSNLFLRI